MHLLMVGRVSLDRCLCCCCRSSNTHPLHNLHHRYSSPLRTADCRMCRSRHHRPRNFGNPAHTVHPSNINHLPRQHSSFDNFNRCYRMDFNYLHNEVRYLANLIMHSDLWLGPRSY